MAPDADAFLKRLSQKIEIKLFANLDQSYLNLPVPNVAWPAARSAALWLFCRKQIQKQLVNCLTLRPIFTFNFKWGGSSRAARFARGAAASLQRARQRLAMINYIRRKMKIEVLKTMHLLVLLLFVMYVDVVKPKNKITFSFTQPGAYARCARGCKAAKYALVAARAKGSG